MSAAYRFAVIGHPLAFTRSPELHRAAFAALGVTGETRALPTPPAALADRLVQFVREGVTGFNVTHPHKEPVIAHLESLSEDAAAARSVNTVGWSGTGWWGESTDGPGFLDWLAHLGRDPARERVLMYGAGGAARSIVLALSRAGAEAPRVVVRGGGPTHREAWRALEGAHRMMSSGTEESRVAEAWATVVLNATPLAGAEGPRDPRALPGAPLVLDLVYGHGPGSWVNAARQRGLEAHDGVGLLVFQGRRGLSRWFGRDVPLQPLIDAVGGLE